MNALYLLDVYTKQNITNNQLEASVSDVILGLTFCLTSHFESDYIIMSLLTSIFTSLLKIISSNFQEMILKIVREYDQELTQSQTADKTVAS